MKLEESEEKTKKLYGLSLNLNKLIFDKESDLNEFCNNEDVLLENTFIIEYLGHVYNEDDVIKKTFINGTSILYSPGDEYGYYILKFDKNNNIYKREYNYGDLTKEYAFFIKKGIKIKNVNYARICEYLYDNLNYENNNDVNKLSLVRKK